MFECRVVLFSIIDNDYKYLAIKNDDLDYYLFHIENDKELAISELEEIVYKEVGVKCSINERINKQCFSIDDENIMFYYVGELETNAINNYKMELLDYKDVTSHLKDPNEKEMVSLANIGITYCMISDLYRQHLSYKYLNIECLPYLELTEEAEKEVKKYIKHYEGSKLYKYIYSCAKIIRYFYGNTHHLEDYHHDEKKYLRELVFHVSMWFPGYLDSMESQRKNR